MKDYGYWENAQEYSTRPSDPPYIWRRGAILFYRRYKISLVDVTFSELRTPAYISATGVRYTCIGNGSLAGPHLIGSDKGSIPPDLQGLSIDNAGHVLPFYFHDFMCLKQGIYIDGKWTRITRKEADRLLFLMLLADGLRYCGSYVVYTGVRTYALAKRIK
jgi:hypothetical protein